MSGVAPSLGTDELAEELAHAHHLATQSPSEALDVLDRLLATVHRRASPDVAARASYLRARLLSERGDHHGALRDIRAARRDWVTAGEPLEALRTDLGMGTVLGEMGEHRQALETTERLLERLDSHRDDPDLTRIIRAGAYGNLGNAHSHMGFYARSIECYDIASNLCAALGRRDLQAQMDACRATVMIKQGVGHRALIELDRARQTFLDLDLEFLAAKCLMDGAEAQLLLGRPFATVRSLARAHEELERLQAVPEIARGQLLEARALSAMGLRRDAHDQAVKAAETFESLNMLLEAGQADQLTGQVSLDLNELDSAEAELGTAERLAEEVGDRTGQARTWLLQARLHAASGRNDDARTLAVRALEVFRDAGHGPDEAAAHLALVHYTDDLARAGEHLSAADRLGATLDLPATQLLYDAAAAYLQRRRGDLDDAVHTLEQALERHRARAEEVGELELYLGPHTDFSRIADELIHTLAEIGSSAAAARAWQVATIASTSLLDSVARQPPGVRATAAFGEDDSTTAPWDELSSRYDDIAEARGSGRSDAARRQIRDIELPLIRRRLTRFAEFPTGSVPRPTLPVTPVVQYHVCGKDIVVLVVRDGYADARVLRDATTETHDLLRSWQTECGRMSARGAQGSAAPGDTGAEVVAAFTDLLVTPVSELLADLDGEPVQVVPHRHLWGIPFEALPLGVDGADEHTFSLRSAHADAAPATTGSTARLELFAVPDDVAPEIDDEATAIRAHAPGARVHLGPDATVEELRAAGPAADLLHVACHGEFHRRDPMFTRLRMADRWLTAAEVTTFDLSGTTVMLGCCDLGRVSDLASEPLGFTWSLFAAGCQGVVAANWRVDDGATALFMATLHEQLRKDFPMPDAVGLARRAVRDKFPHPYYWAAFRHFSSPEQHPEGTTP